MRKPKFDRRSYDTIWKPNTDIWYLVFPSASARKRFRQFDFSNLPVTTVQTFMDSYVCSTEYVTNIGYRKAIPTRHREEQPRLYETVMLDEEPVSYGTITNVNWPEREITVQFDNDYRYWNFSEFQGNWTDKHGGMWIMEG